MTDIEKGSYALGHQIGTGARKQYENALDSDAVVQGLLDGLAERSSKLSTEETEAAQSRLADIVTESRNVAARATIAAGKAFLDENGKREGVVTTDSGLQYEVMTEGSGANPEATDTVVTHYHGTLLDGTVFDSSVERGQPAEFPLNRVIKGWTEALQLMSPGAKYRLYLPPELAYGERGAGQSIGPNATLIFEVELLEIKGS